MKIILQNQLVKVKSSLRSQLSEEIAKPIYNSTTFIDARNNIETLVSMVEMAYGLPYQHEDPTVAINLVDAQLERDLSQSLFDRDSDQDRFEMIRILNEERVEYSKGKSPDLEQLLKKIGSISKPIEEEAPEDETLQVALTAQIRKSEYQGTQAKNWTGPKHVQNSRPDRVEHESDSRLTRLILNLKAKIGVLRKAMVNHGISVESAPTSNKQEEQSAVVKQNGRFAGIAKKKNRCPVNSIQPHEPNLSDSDNESQQHALSMIVIKPARWIYPPRP